jgi:hypothetical protein
MLRADKENLAERGALIEPYQPPITPLALGPCISTANTVGPLGPDARSGKEWVAAPRVLPKASSRHGNFVVSNNNCAVPHQGA